MRSVSGAADVRPFSPRHLAFVLPLILLHLACGLVFVVGASRVAVAAFLFTATLQIFGITTGFPRLLAHRAFKTSRAFQLALAALGVLAGQNGPLWWVSPLGRFPFLHAKNKRQKRRTGMLTSFDALLIAVAVLILGIGLTRWSSRWLAGQEEIRKGSPSALAGYLLGSGRILKGPLQGSAHVFVFWGVVLPALAVLVSQFRPSLPGVFSNLLSLFLDLLGLAMLCAMVFMLVRRWAQRDEAGPKRTAVPALTLLGIVVTGFLAEGTRLSILGPGFSWQSLVGSVF